MLSESTTCVAIVSRGVGTWQHGDVPMMLVVFVIPTVVIRLGSLDMIHVWLIDKSGIQSTCLIQSLAANEVERMLVLGRPLLLDLDSNGLAALLKGSYRAKVTVEKSLDHQSWFL